MKHGIVSFCDLDTLNNFATSCRGSFELCFANDCYMNEAVPKMIEMLRRMHLDSEFILEGRGSEDNRRHFIEFFKMLRIQSVESDVGILELKRKKDFVRIVSIVDRLGLDFLTITSRFANYDLGRRAEAERLILRRWERIFEILPQCPNLKKLQVSAGRRFFQHAQDLNFRFDLPKIEEFCFNQVDRCSNRDHTNLSGDILRLWRDKLNVKKVIINWDQTPHFKDSRTNYKALWDCLRAIVRTSPDIREINLQNFLETDELYETSYVLNLTYMNLYYNFRTYLKQCQLDTMQRVVQDQEGRERIVLGPCFVYKSITEPTKGDMSKAIEQKQSLPLPFKKQDEDENDVKVRILFTHRPRPRYID